MYQTFNIISLDTLYAEKKIIIYTNFDVNPASVNGENIKLYDSSLKNSLNVSFETNNKNIIITILEEINPNFEYLLSVSNIKTVLSDEISSGIKRKIIFESQVKETASISSPTDYEEVEFIKVKMQAFQDGNNTTLGDDKYFFLEVSDDIAYINTIYSARVYSNEINLQTMSPGQYYMRCRVEMSSNGNEAAGRWSDTSSFILVPPRDIDAPNFSGQLEIVSTLPNGETPSNILIEFSKDIIKDFNNIVVIRRDV